MQNLREKDYFQNHMPGNVCFGCGKENHQGLKISSYWEGFESVCIWESQEKYQGWKGILNGGILATARLEYLEEQKSKKEEGDFSASRRIGVGQF